MDRGLEVDNRKYRLCCFQVWRLRRYGQRGLEVDNGKYQLCCFQEWRLRRYG